MNFKDLVVPLSLAFLTTWAFQHFFGERQSSDKMVQQTSGERVTAPTTTDLSLYKPLNVEVDFLDKTVSKKAIKTPITTAHARYVFSTEGASLEHAEFKRNWGGQQGYLSTVFPPAQIDKERKAFLIGLNEKTPYYFDLTNKTEDDEHVLLQYSANFGDGIMHKDFTIFKDEYRIDLMLTLEPKEGIELQPRIFFPAPIIPELGKEDWIKALVNEGKDTVRVYEKNEQTLEGYWLKPTLFGTQDRYFIHALAHDHDNFAQRGYFKIFDLETLSSILEGPAIKEQTSWKLTFYFGPKEDLAIKAVDERLTQVLNYGWFSFISRPVSKILLGILNFLFDYFHNYGIAIIILTILMKLLMLPFTFNSEKQLKKRNEFERKLKYAQEKYKNDSQALAQARAELIRTHGLPGLGSMLPMLLQIPLFIALSWVLGNSIELYKAPFLWIKDLSAVDPYYILPILLGVTMLFHNPAGTTDPRQRLSSIVMALVFAAFTANLPAGLVLYIATSTFSGVIQSYFTRRFAS